MAKRSSLRASDADRDRVAQRLHEAAVEGRLLAHELEERVARALRAKTYGDLDAVVSDLPGAPVTAGRRSVSRELIRSQPLAAAAIGVAVMLIVVVMAAVVIAALLALSGVWALILLFVVLHRRGRSGHHGRRQRYGHHEHHGRRGGRRQGARASGSAPWLS